MIACIKKLKQFIQQVSWNANYTKKNYHFLVELTKENNE